MGAALCRCLGREGHLGGDGRRDSLALAAFAAAHTQDLLLSPLHPMPPQTGDGGEAGSYGDFRLVIEGVTTVGVVVGGDLLGGWWTFN
eukprot:SAG22_NODE_778_length_7279_cov_3.312256_4_plen_88_part_00